jgi:predicted enzyme related to lactoylglutathione lyase
MASPIDNKIGAVFVPVSDMQRAIAWYSRLFDLPIETTTHEGRIYNVPMAGDVGLILDGHRPVANSSQPQCFFWTSDIHTADEFLRRTGVEIVRGGIQDIGGLFTLTFQDLDGNLLMACQRKG